MKRNIIIAALLAATVGGMLSSCCGRQADELPAYRIYDSSGKESSYGKMLKAISAADVIFIGETHNCPIAHWLEYKITGDVWSRDSTGLVLAAEMFEKDNQDAVDAYVAGDIDSDELEEQARLWSNFWTDYQPLLFFAREHGLKFVASNVPRKYASMVRYGGFEALDSLPDCEKAMIAPLPIDFEASEDDDDMFGMMRMLAGGSNDGPSYFAEAQAIKDATMAWSIAQGFDRKLIHYNGNYHSDNHGGIVPYLEKYLPGKRIATVCCVRQEDICSVDEENLGRADFIVCVPESMTMTF